MGQLPTGHTIMQNPIFAFLSVNKFGGHIHVNSYTYNVVDM